MSDSGGEKSPAGVMPQFFMREALRMAEVALEMGDMPIGAIAVLGNRVLSARHQEGSEGRKLGHAELLALDDADRLNPFPGERSALQLFSTLEPCMLCMGAAMAMKAGEIYYAMEAPLDGAAALVQRQDPNTSGLPEYRSFPKIHGGLLRAESLALFERYVARHGPRGKRWAWAKALLEVVQDSGGKPSPRAIG